MQRKGLRRLPRNVWVMSATSLLNDISSEMLLNLIPFFLANILGVRTSVIGLIDGIAETTASLMKVFFGALSDRYGKRKPFAVAGYALSAFTKPLLYFATAWGWVLSVRVADRIGKGIRTAPRDALIADSVDQTRARHLLRTAPRRRYAGRLPGPGHRICDHLAVTSQRKAAGRVYIPDRCAGKYRPRDSGGAGPGVRRRGDREQGKGVRKDPPVLPGNGSASSNTSS